MGEFFIYLVSFPFEWNSHLHFPGGGVVKNLPANAGGARDADSMPGSAILSSILAWKIPWTEELGGL